MLRIGRGRHCYLFSRLNSWLRSGRGGEILKANPWRKARSTIYFFTKSLNSYSPTTYKHFPVSSGFHLVKYRYHICFWPLGCSLTGWTLWRLQRGATFLFNFPILIVADKVVLYFFCWPRGCSLTECTVPVHYEDYTLANFLFNFLQYVLSESIWT